MQASKYFRVSPFILVTTLCGRCYHYTAQKTTAGICVRLGGSSKIAAQLANDRSNPNCEWGAHAVCRCCITWHSARGESQDLVYTDQVLYCWEPGLYPHSEMDAGPGLQEGSCLVHTQPEPPRSGPSLCWNFEMPITSCKESHSLKLLPTRAALLMKWINPHLQEPSLQRIPCHSSQPQFLWHLFSSGFLGIMYSHVLSTAKTVTQAVSCLVCSKTSSPR